MKGIDVGNACNNNCIMCTQLRRPFGNAKIGQKMHGKSDLLAQIETASAESGIAFTGGEPTIRKDLFELVEFVKEKFPEKRICLLTNGRMLAYSGYGPGLEKAGLGEIIIPLHGHNAALHDFITQADGSFGQTVQGIKNLGESGLARELRVVVHKVNYVFLPQIADFIEKQFGFVDRVVFLYFDAIGSASANRKRLFVPYSEVSPFLAGAFERLGKMRGKARLYHFPQCVLPAGLRRAVYGRTVGMERVVFPKACGQCVYRRKCPGVWKTYRSNFGLGEFKPVKRNG